MVLDHPQNTQGVNITIPIAFTFGNQTIWVTEGYVIVGEASSYINETNFNNVCYN